jgi:thymidylate kinase
MAVHAAKLIVLEGIDGVGKTTLARELAARSAGKLRYCSPKTIATSHPHLEWSMQTLASLLWPEESRKQHAHLLPSAYWLSLQAAWYSVLSEAVIAAQLCEAQALVIDGWYYKFVAKMAVGGAKIEPTLAAFAGSREPDLVVLLEGSPEGVWSRRRFSAYEMGSMTGYDELGEASFVAYQSKIQAALVGLADRNGWRRERLSASDTIESNVGRLQQIVFEAL